MNRLYTWLRATGTMPQPAKEAGLAVLFVSLGFVGGFFFGLWLITL